MQYFRLSPYLFHFVLSHIQDDLQRPATNFNANPITPSQKLCVTLRYLATGESFRSLAFQYRISFSYTSIIVKEVLKAIKKHLFTIAVPTPTEQSLKTNAEHNFTRWNFPNCVGSIDGKHVRIVCPPKTGSLCWNFKSFFSVVLLAIVDGNLRFVAIDVGAYGREGDAGIFERSNMGQAIAAGTFNMPPPSEIPGSNLTVPNVLLGDSAFALTENMMVPFSQRQAAEDSKKRTFNYR